MTPALARQRRPYDHELENHWPEVEKAASLALSLPPSLQILLPPNSHTHAHFTPMPPCLVWLCGHILTISYTDFTQPTHCASANNPPPLPLKGGG